MKRAAACIFVLLVPLTALPQDIYNRGRAALSARDTSGALTAFQDALKAGQRPAESNYYLGAIALARNDVDGAIRYLEASVKLRDSNPDVLRTLGEAYVMKGDGGNALRYLRLAAKEAPKDCGVMISYGRALLTADSVDAAIVYLTRAKECAPEDPVIYIGLGDAYIKQGVVVLGIINYKEAVRIAPHNFEYRYILARAYEKNRQWNDAVSEYNEVITLDSTYADAYLQKGTILYRAKRYRDAIDPLRRYDQLRKGNFDAKLMLAKAQVEIRDKEEALKNARAAVQLDSSGMEVWRTYFQTLVMNNEFTQAESALRSMQRRGELEPGDYLSLGDLYNGLKRDDDALTWYLKAVEADSAMSEPLATIGTILMKKGQYADAATWFERKIAAEPNHLSSYVNGAVCHMQAKNFDRVKELLDKAVELKNDYFPARLWRARYYVQVDSFARAEQEYKGVLEIIGDQTERYRREYGEAHGLLGSLYMSKGVDDRSFYFKAIDSFRKAVGAGYENTNLVLSWGQCVLQTLDPKGDAEENRKKIEEAIRLFRRSIQLDQNNAQGHLWLAEGLIRARIPGEDEKNRVLKEEACSEYKKALRLDPKLDDAKKAMERVGCS